MNYIQGNMQLYHSEHSKRNQLLSSDINFKAEIRHHWVKLYRYHNLHSKITAHEVQIIKHYKTFHIKDNQCRISWQDTWYQFPYFNFEALAEQSADVSLQDDFGTYLCIWFLHYIRNYTNHSPYTRTMINNRIWNTTIVKIEKRNTETLCKAYIKTITM